MLGRLTTFDPFDPSSYRLMRQWARAVAYSMRRDPGDGEEALQDVLLQVSSGDLRPLRWGQNSLKACIRNRLLTAVATDGDRAETNARLVLSGRIPGGLAVSPFVVLLGLTEEAELQELQALLAPALRDLEAKQAEHAQGFKARLRQQLLSAGGGQELVAFERWYGVSLGVVTGTTALAAVLGLPEGTVAAHAHRGEKQLVEMIRGMRKEGRRVRDEHL